MFHRTLVAAILFISIGMVYAIKPTYGALVITEVLSNTSHGGGANNSDWFEVTNVGLVTLDVSGFSWDDESAEVGIGNFGSITMIAPGESVIITEESAANVPTAWRNSWGIPDTVQVSVSTSAGGFPGLGAAGDALSIFDSAGTLVDSVTFGAASGGDAGRSFAWDTAGNPLGLSVAGVNGAFLSDTDGGDGSASGTGTDVGSPGTAVVIPEPTSFLALLGISGCCVLRRRKKS